MAQSRKGRQLMKMMAEKGKSLFWIYDNKRSFSSKINIWSGNVFMEDAACFTENDTKLDSKKNSGSIN